MQDLHSVQYYINKYFNSRLAQFRPFPQKMRQDRIEISILVTPCVFSPRQWKSTFGLFRGMTILLGTTYFCYTNIKRKINESYNVVLIDALIVTKFITNSEKCNIITSRQYIDNKLIPKFNYTRTYTNKLGPKLGQFVPVNYNR